MALTRLANTPTAGKTTYRFQYAGDTAVIDKKADQMAHSLFNAGLGDHGTPGAPRSYESLTLTEKLDIVDDYVLSVILNMSRSYAVNQATATATAAEESEIVT